MPITVKHDTGGGDLSGLAMLMAAAGAAQANVPGVTQQIGITSGSAGGFGGGGGGGGGRRRGLSSRDQFAMQAEELKAARDNQMRDIDARADREKQSADEAMKRVAVQGGMATEMEEQEYDNEVKKIQEKAKADAQKFKWGFGPDVKRRMAKDNMDLQAIQDAMEEGRIDEEQGEAEIQRINRKLEGYQATAMPADPDRRPDPGSTMWTDPVTGDRMRVGRSGTDEVATKWKDTKEGLQIAQGYEDRAAALAAREKMLLATVSTTVAGQDKYG